MLEPFDPISKPDWPGSTSLKFSGSRKHIFLKDSIQDFTGGPLPLLGRKHFEDQYDVPKVFKSSLRLYPHHNKESTLHYTLQDKKHFAFKPIEKKPRPERKHSYDEDPQKEIDLRGIKVFECNNRGSSSTWGVEKAMQTKTRVRGLMRARNHIPLASLGDKIYKHPDYSTDFFKGLEKRDKNKKKEKNAITIVHFDKNSMTFKERIKVEARLEDEKAVDELFKWEENVLQEANPNWKDVDKVGPPDLFAEREKLVGAKKPEPAKKK